MTRRSPAGRLYIGAHEARPIHEEEEERDQHQHRLHQEGAGGADGSGDGARRSRALSAHLLLQGLRELPLHELGAALYALAALIETDSLVEWNDDPRQTQENVLAVLDRAAATYVAPAAVVELSLN